MKRVCINCAHLKVKEDEDHIVRRGHYICDLYKERANVTSPWVQTCGDNWMDPKIIRRDEKLNEILNGR